MAPLAADPGLVEDERVLLGQLAVTLEATRLAAVPGFHVHAQQQHLVVGLEPPEPRNPLRRLEILHLAVPQAGRHQHRRIGLLRDVVVR